MLEQIGNVKLNLKFYNDIDLYTDGEIEDELLEIVKKNEESIATKVLADSFDFDAEYSVKKEWNVNGESVTISIEKRV